LDSKNRTAIALEIRMCNDTFDNRTCQSEEIIKKFMKYTNIQPYNFEEFLAFRG